MTVAGVAVFVGGIGGAGGRRGPARRQPARRAHLGPGGDPAGRSPWSGGTLAVLQRGRVVRAVGALAGAAAAGGWAVVRLGVLWHAEVPTDLAPVTERALTSLALATAIGAAIVVVRSGALAPPPLAPDAAGDDSRRSPSRPTVRPPPTTADRPERRRARSARAVEGVGEQGDQLLVQEREAQGGDERRRCRRGC